jgi:hypothetical protein
MQNNLTHFFGLWKIKKTRHVEREVCSTHFSAIMSAVFHPTFYPAQNAPDELPTWENIFFQLRKLFFPTGHPFFHNWPLLVINAQWNEKCQIVSKEK